MGLDLQLLPMESDHGDMAFSHSIIRCHRDGELFDAICGIEKDSATSVTKNFFSYLATGRDGESRYDKTTKTPYGEALTAVTVAELVKLKAKAWEYNRAAWAYLAHLPPTMRVVLFWH